MGVGGALGGIGGGLGMGWWVGWRKVNLRISKANQLRKGDKNIYHCAFFKRTLFLTIKHKQIDGPKIFFLIKCLHTNHE